MLHVNGALDMTYVCECMCTQMWAHKKHGGNSILPNLPNPAWIHTLQLPVGLDALSPKQLLESSPEGLSILEWLSILEQFLDSTANMPGPGMSPRLYCH